MQRMLGLPEPLQKGPCTAFGQSSEGAGGLRRCAGYPALRLSTGRQYTNGRVAMLGIVVYTLTSPWTSASSVYNRAAQAQAAPNGELYLCKGQRHSPQRAALCHTHQSWGARAEGKGPTCMQFTT